MQTKSRPNVFLPSVEVYKGDDPYIFLSYAHEDKLRVYVEIERFYKMGFRIWYDEGLSPAKEFPKELQEAIEKSSYFIVFISENSVRSTYVRDEIYFARKMSIEILPIYLEETELIEGLALRIGSIQSIMKYDITEKVYDLRLKEILPENLLQDSVNGSFDSYEKTLDTKNSEKRKHKEKEFQVFITFKNLTEDGEQTIDSKLAKEVFKYLSIKGFNVFHDIISIEKLGIDGAAKAIEAALKSCQIMVIVATSANNIRAKRVQDEWKRFSELIKNGLKPHGVIFLYTTGFALSNLPENLLQEEPIIHGDESLENLYSRILKLPGFETAEDVNKKKSIKKEQIVWLLKLNGDGPDKVVITLGEEEAKLTVGRANTNDIVLNPRYISRHHAEIRYSKKGLIVKDLHSKNGTLVNNIEIKIKELKLGDELKFDAISYKICLPQNNRKD